MRTAGVAKFLAIAAGVLLYVGSLIIERLGRRSEPGSDDCPGHPHIGSWTGKGT